MKSAFRVFSIYLLFTFDVIAGTIYVTPSNGSTQWCAVGQTSKEVQFNIGGTYSGYPYVGIYKFVVALDGVIIFNNPGVDPLFTYTVSGIGSHSIYVEMWEENYLGQRIRTTISNTTFNLELSYNVTIANSFGGGGSVKVDGSTVNNVPSEGIIREWGKNRVYSLEGINNQTINNLLRTWREWKKDDSQVSTNIQITTSVTATTDFDAVYNTQPTIPTNLSVSTQGGIQLSWSANPEPTIQYYEVWRKINSGSFNLLTTTTSTSYEDPDFAPGGSMSLTYKIRAKDNNGLFSDYSSTVYVSNAAPYKKGIGFVRSEDIPQQFMLKQNYPNPFNPATEISYSIPQPLQVKLHIYNSIGQAVIELVNEYQDIGHYTIQWNAGTLPSGIYFYQLSAGKYSETKRMILAK